MVLTAIGSNRCSRPHCSRSVCISLKRDLKSPLHAGTGDSYRSGGGAIHRNPATRIVRIAPIATTAAKMAITTSTRSSFLHPAGDFMNMVGNHHFLDLADCKPRKLSLLGGSPRAIASSCLTATRTTKERKATIKPTPPTERTKRYPLEWIIAMTTAKAHSYDSRAILTTTVPGRRDCRAVLTGYRTAPRRHPAGQQTPSSWRCDGGQSTRREHRLGGDLPGPDVVRRPSPGGFCLLCGQK
jgi:hypothetical protein